MVLPVHPVLREITLQQFQHRLSVTRGVLYGEEVGEREKEGKQAFL